MAMLKPTAPLLASNKGPLKPASPLRPKTAPKTPISHPQRRSRFQPHTGTSEQRRSWFQTTGPPDRQGLAGVEPTRPATGQHAGPHWCGGHRRDRKTQEGLAAVPVGGGGAWPGFETTRRAKLAARTARGRAAAHGHTEQPGPPGRASARNTRGTASNPAQTQRGARSAAAPRAPHSRVSVAHRLSWMLRPGTASISSRV